ncbi:TetR/AcrR family transcriptional regulator [Halopseudomonas pelagia]|uniref:TetR family transcriptional regulator n=2 Tax=Halopseudomonas TaxID=2901189 RepID=A0AA91U049_9GAMM|nr:TetR/AcrR family transcriptional regulator [Halopseudomonas pelagia]PCC98258.1 TetR family transcriptional regulator [Halopseudomonas pelagia]QFY57105.1 TetR/AcrR family transcriptional regulator [Halopseudomonas pelagia]
MDERPLAAAGPGRPVDPEKLDRILDAVLDSFAEGDMHFTIEGVARRADVSKGTIYRHFDNAEALLQAVLTRLHRNMLGNLPEIEECAGGLREQLIILGTQLLDFLTSEQGVRIMRTVIAHGARQAEHGQWIYRDGPQAFVIRAATCLSAAHERGRIELKDPLLTAEQLIGMWKGSLVSGLWMNGRPLPDAAEKRYRVESAVDLLLRGLNWSG